MKIAFLTILALLPFTAQADVYEIVVSGFKPGFTEETEREMSKSLNKFIKKQPGFLGRELFYDPKQKLWVDVIKWNSKTEAEAAAKKAESSSVCQPVFSAIEQKGMIFLHAEKVLTFKK